MEEEPEIEAALNESPMEEPAIQIPPTKPEATGPPMDGPTGGLA